MKYNKDVLLKEFRHYSSECGAKDDACELLVDIINKYYDIVKIMPTEVIKSLLPTPKHTGPHGTYFEDWMIRQCNSTRHYPFTIEACIMDWYGDRTTTDVVKAVGNSIDEVLQRLLITYIYYLEYYSKSLSDKKEAYADIINSMQEYVANLVKVIKQYE